MDDDSSDIIPLLQLICVAYLIYSIFTLSFWGLVLSFLGIEILASPTIRVAGGGTNRTRWDGDLPSSKMDVHDKPFGEDW